MGIDRHPTSERIAEELRGLRSQVHRGMTSLRVLYSPIAASYAAMSGTYGLKQSYGPCVFPRWCLRGGNGMRNCGRAVDCIQTDAAVMGLPALVGITQTCDSVFALHEVCGICSNQNTYTVNTG